MRYLKKFNESIEELSPYLISFWRFLEENIPDEIKIEPSTSYSEYIKKEIRDYYSEIQKEELINFKKLISKKVLDINYINLEVKYDDNMGRNYLWVKLCESENLYLELIYELKRDGIIINGARGFRYIINENVFVVDDIEMYYIRQIIDKFFLPKENRILESKSDIPEELYTIDLYRYLEENIADEIDVPTVFMSKKDKLMSYLYRKGKNPNYENRTEKLKIKYITIDVKSVRPNYKYLHINLNESEDKYLQFDYEIAESNQLYSSLPDDIVSYVNGKRVSTDCPTISQMNAFKNEKNMNIYNVLQIIFKFFYKTPLLSYLNESKNESKKEMRVPDKTYTTDMWRYLEENIPDEIIVGGYKININYISILIEKTPKEFHNDIIIIELHENEKKYIDLYYNIQKENYIVIEECNTIRYIDEHKVIHIIHSREVVSVLNVIDKFLHEVKFKYRVEIIDSKKGFIKKLLNY